MEKDNIKGFFVSSVLLSQNQWDKKQFIHDFEEDWGIVLTDDDDNGDVLVGMFSGMTLAIAIMPGPVPNGEAEHYAQGNYLWKDATEVARQHEAHILVSVTGDQSNLLERAKLFTRATSSCLKQSYATAVYTDGMVFQPEFYRDMAALLQEDELPVMDWVWFGIYRTQKGIPGIYTYGLRKFGKEEIEVYAPADLSDIRDFLMDIVHYILSDDVTLQDGETIGFSEEQKLAITLSEGIALDGMTLKLEYPDE